MAAGFIYVLVNSSYPGLFKVGKTTRDVAERCRELTSATGVPTPFVVAFEQYFQDCDSAERAVHLKLSHAGQRQSDNREFFRGSPNDIIRTILAVAESEPAGLVDDDGTATKTREPWEDVFAEASKLENRPENLIVDEDEAKRLYITAAQLGAPLGYRMAGYIAARQRAPGKDSAPALFIKGAAYGDNGCTLALADYFETQGDIARARMVWSELFSKLEEQPIGPGKTYISLDRQCFEYLRYCHRTGEAPIIASLLQQNDDLIRNVWDEAVSSELDCEFGGGARAEIEEASAMVTWLESKFFRAGDKWLANARFEVTKYHDERIAALAENTRRKKGITVAQGWLSRGAQLCRRFTGASI